MDNKILILGSDGMAGHMVKSYLKEKGFDVSSSIRSESKGKDYHYDVLENYKELEKIINEVKPDFVINCIGVLTKYSEVHKPEAVLLNSFLPHYLGSLSEKNNFKLIHISTDCVFSGEKGSYTEDDLADEHSFYGRTKSLGELNNDRNLTFRTSIVGPDINENGVGLFNWFMKQEGEIKGFRKAIWSGVTTLELAKAMEKSFSMDISGLYHLVNNEKINKFDLLSLFKKYTGKDIIIDADDEFESDKSLVNTRKDIDFSIPSYEKMVDEMCQWIKDHKEKYNLIRFFKNE